MTEKIWLGDVNCGECVVMCDALIVLLPGRRASLNDET
jgi:hypothetical protein